MRFKDRIDAGQRLASELSSYSGEMDLLVLGLARGGVPVAAEVARALNAELDVLLVRKLGLPWQPELAAGAIAFWDTCVFNDDIIRSSGLSEGDLKRVIETQQRELQRREKRYRSDRPPLRIKGRHVIVVDDGLATGATMTAALTALQSLQPSRVTVAVPVAAPETLERIEYLADDIVCLQTPEDLFAVGAWYQDFTQVEDEEVIRLLEPASRPR